MIDSDFTIQEVRLQTQIQQGIHKMCTTHDRRTMRYILKSHCNTPQNSSNKTEC